MKGKVIIGKVNSSRLSLSFAFNLSPLSISRQQRMEFTFHNTCVILGLVMFSTELTCWHNRYSNKVTLDTTQFTFLCPHHLFTSRVYFSLDVNHPTQQSINQQNKTNVPSGAPGFNPKLLSYSIFCFLHSVCVSLFVLFLFGYCIVWPSSIYSFWWSLRYLQTCLTRSKKGNYD
jgi:hypothetical protein